MPECDLIELLKRRPLSPGGSGRFGAPPVGFSTNSGLRLLLLNLLYIAPESERNVLLILC